MSIAVHVACDHELFRKSIGALLDCHDDLEVRETNPEGVRGVSSVRVPNLSFASNRWPLANCCWCRQADMGRVEGGDCREVSINLPVSADDGRLKPAGRVSSKKSGHCLGQLKRAAIRSRRRVQAFSNSGKLAHPFA